MNAVLVRFAILRCLVTLGGGSASQPWRSASRRVGSIPLLLALAGVPLVLTPTAAEAWEVIAWGNNGYGQGTVPPEAQSGVIAIAGGANHNLALTSAGEVIAWGYNEYGQVGDAPTETGFTAIAAGRDHSLALTGAGEVIAWGYNGYTQVSGAPAGTGFAAIAGGGDHSLALTEAGEVIAWGRNSDGQCTVPLEAQSGVIAIAAGASHSLALTEAGEVIAWGDNDYAQCALPPGLPSVVAIARGWQHSLALTEAGEVIAWGDNDWGQCNVPPGLPSVVAIDGGGGHSLALTVDGEVIAWGINLQGQCAVPLEAESGVLAIAAGAAHSLALLPPGPVADFVGNPTSGPVPLTVYFTDLSTKDPSWWEWDFGDTGTSSLQNPSHDYTSAGQFTVSLTATDAEGSNTETKTDYITVIPVGAVIAWGRNWEGQCTVPAAAQSGVLAIAAGGYHNLALTEAGEVIAWGYDFYGQVSDAPTGTGFTAIDGGGYHNLALTEAGQVIAWGRNLDGQCNVPPEAQSGVTAIAGGYAHSLALTVAGKVIAWGYNYYGQCDVPLGLPSVVAIASGEEHSLALIEGGVVVAWGDNDAGQCNVPPSLPSVVAIASGEEHSLALTEAGEVIAWGNNVSGQLNVPVEAQSGVIAIAGGHGHSLALTEAGQVIAWGRNLEDQLNVPAAAQSGVLAIAAKGDHGLALLALQADFLGSPTSGPAPLTVDFTDQSTNDPTSWEWDFGDGGVSAEQHPSHEYLTAGTYTVSLTAENASGENTETKTDYITVVEPPVADFVGDPTSGPVPLTVSFTDLSTNDPTSWDWTFGDGGTDTVQHPSHEYTSTGQFTVSLTAANAAGQDIATKTAYITVAVPPVADFVGDPTSGPVLLTVSFTDQSTNDPTSWDWTFGDGGTDTVQHPSHEYTSPGQFTVSLTAANAGGQDTETKTNYITVAMPPVADFVADPTSGPVPLTVSFTDLSTNDPTSWDWTFGDGGTDTVQHPSHEYTSPGQFTVSLTAANAGGQDTETKTNYITVAVPPVADFVGDPTSGPVPLTVQFTDQSTNDPTSWDWDFGDGGADTVQNASHEYTSPGQFTVSLTAANAGGQHTETKTNYITVTRADFVGNPTIGPVPLTVDFTDQSTNDPTSWDWDFGDTGTSSLQHPSHDYTSTGQFTVSLTAANAGGQDTETKPNYITVTVPPPVGDPIAWGRNSEGQCTVPPAAQSGVTAIASGLYHSLALTSAGEVIAWGDDSEGQCTVPPEAQSGVLAIDGGLGHSLALTSAGEVIAWGDDSEGQCTVPTEAQSGVIGIAAGWQHSLALTSAGGEVIAWGSNLEDQLNVPAEAQSGVIAIDAGVWHSLALTDTGEVIAWGDNAAGQCTVPADLPSVTAIAAGGGHSLALTDTGQVIAWGSNFYGQCTVPTEAQSGVIAIAAGQLYSLALTSAGEVIAWGSNDQGQCTVPAEAQSGVLAIDSGGDHSLALLPLQADFSGSPTSGPVPLTVQFTDQSTNDPTSWDWDFGDTGTSSLQNPSHEYTSIGQFTVSLTAANGGGQDTETKPDYITVTVAPPVAEFSGSPTGGAVPLTVDFTDLSTNDPTSWDWDFGDGGADTVQNPSHDYTSTGQFTVSLTAANAGGQDTETKTDYITVAVAPVADFVGNPTSGPVTLTVQFTDQSTNSPTDWQWELGDGGVSTDQHPTHTYVSPGMYTVSLTAANAGGQDTETKTDYIRLTVGPPAADFVGNPTSGPVPLTVDFTDLSTNNPPWWEWDFGDGGADTVQHPSHEYTSTGQFTVSLTAANAGGQDTETKTDYITVAVPPAADFVGSPTSGPVPLTVDFTDQSTNDPTSWDWDFGDGGADTVQHPSHEYTSTGQFTVSLTAANPGGQDTETKTDYITAGVAGVAAFSAAPTEGIMGMSVTFTDESNSDIDSWDWDFGDGGAATAQHPSHVYADPGIYNVSLTVTGAYSSDTETKSQYIWVGFLDSGPDNWAFQETLLCVDADIVQGYPGGYYQPTWAVNRGQMAVYIARAIAGGDSAVPDASAPATFDDVSDTNSTWAWKYVEYAVAHDVVQGYDENTYAPEVEVDRGQMAVFIARGKGWVILGEDMTTAPELFPDVPAGFWAGTAVETCVDNGVVQGYLDGNYHPTDIVTRDQMAVYVARAFGLAM